ncbi:MAG TPA: hypothetical protein VLI92_01225 [Candidatus Saccharimonadales bacterium]|nr:hypothetical protein [Candidatus Saccharimonadales bacterium]
MPEEIINHQPRERAKERACDAAVKNTLKYRAIFKYPMSFFQLQTFLICKKGFDYEFFKKTVRKLHKKNSIKAKEEKFMLPTLKPLSWDLRAKYSKEHLQRCEKVFKKLEAIKWIKFLGVTGSVAAFNADKDDDVDIFIITEKNRLWLTRLFVVLTLKSLGVYRTEENPNKKICPNILIDESQLEWDKEKQNIYVAHEIAMMHPVINRDNIYFRFLKRNRWINTYLGNFNVNYPEKFANKSKDQSEFVTKLESIVRSAQMKYMKKKQTSEVTTNNFIHFNKHDWTPKILTQFEQKSE